LKKIQSVGVVLVLALLLASAALIHSSAAEGSQVYEGPGWRLEISENPLIDTSTGQAYSSAGEAIAAGDPGYWASIPDALKAKYEAVPAVQRQASLSLTPTPEQQERINALGGIEMSEAEYLSLVFPDLWKVVPGWQKEIWAGQLHRGTGSSSLFAGNRLSGSLAGYGAGGLQTGSLIPAKTFANGDFSGGSFSPAVGSQVYPVMGFNPFYVITPYATGSGSPLFNIGDNSIPADYAVPANFGAEKSIFSGQSSMTGSTSPFASVLSSPGSSGFGYGDQIGAPAGIARFGSFITFPRT
jgi:hypothetical protein